MTSADQRAANREESGASGHAHGEAGYDHAGHDHSAHAHPEIERRSHMRATVTPTNPTTTAVRASAAC